MSIIRIKKSEDTSFIVLDSNVLNDARLSFQAKGLHAYLMSRPDGWDCSIETLSQESLHDGRKAIRSAVKELEEAGYARLTRHRGVGGWELVISDTADLTDTNDFNELNKLISALINLIPQDQPINGYVYVLQAGPYFKIGKAEFADKRIVALPIQLPFKAEPVHLMGCEDYVQAEQFFHRRYDEKRTNGEWFLLDENELRELQVITYMPSASLEK